MQAIKAAIDRMAPNGNTNVPEGIAWGWRTVSSSEPFTEGRPDGEKGNDKVVIVLTDGANTYSVPNNDPAGNKSTYAAYGYLQPGYNGTGIGRLLTGTERRPVQLLEPATTPAALDEHMATLCDHAKAANIMVMTVSLDLSTTNAEREQGDRGAEEMRVGFALPQGPDRPIQAREAVLQRRRGNGNTCSRTVQGDRRRAFEPADRQLIDRGPVVPCQSIWAAAGAAAATAFGLRSRNASGMAHSVTTIISLKSST